MRLKTEAKISARVVKDMIISGLDFPGRWLAGDANYLKDHGHTGDTGHCGRTMSLLEVGKRPVAKEMRRIFSIIPLEEFLTAGAENARC